MSRRRPYPPIGDYGLISDGRSMALVSGTGSIDWCCMPRVDAPSCFGRILDWDRGGHCTIAPVADRVAWSRQYVQGTMVLATTAACAGGTIRILDCFAMRGRARATDPSRLIRVVEGVRGAVRVDLRVAPRFDYGGIRPWIRTHDRRLGEALGGSFGLLVAAGVDLEPDGHDLAARWTIRRGERVSLVLEWTPPLAGRGEMRPGAAGVDGELDATIRAWRGRAARIRPPATDAGGVVRSALVLEALANPLTGAIVAAPTTSLPEAAHGVKNWDYRYSWVRDSAFSARALADVGSVDAAGRFRRFVEVAAAGAADQLQVAYGVGGERRLTEFELPLHGYRGARPVRVGNQAAAQRQLDVYGELAELTWRWHERGHRPDDDAWRFLRELVETAARCWPEPDHGIWESRGEPRQHVHSKALLWTALDRGIRLARDTGRRAPVARWARTRDAIRRAIERHGYDRRRNTFVQSFGGDELDAALLRLPMVGFVDAGDPRMVGTVAAIRRDLDAGGLLRRSRTEGEASGATSGREGCLVACTFWLAECLAAQGRDEDARRTFDHAVATRNDLGLFAEEFDPVRGELTGNFPQALTHLSHISAAAAIERGRRGTQKEMTA